MLLSLVGSGPGEAGRTEPDGSGPGEVGGTELAGSGPDGAGGTEPVGSGSDEVGAAGLAEAESTGLAGWMISSR